MRRLKCDSPLWMLSVTTLQPLRFYSCRCDRLDPRSSARCDSSLQGEKRRQEVRKHSRPACESRRGWTREAFRRSLAPRQPVERGVLLRRDGHRQRTAARARTRARCCASRPARSGGAIADRSRRCWRRSSARAARAGVDARLLPHLACRRGLERLVAPVERAGDRLPVARTRGALEEQHFAAAPYAPPPGPRPAACSSCFAVEVRQRAACAAGSTNTAKNGLPRPAQNSALERSTSISTPRSSRRG